MNKPAENTAAQTTTNGQAAPAERKRLYALSLGALGVVFGDIGTSPLYTMSSAFSGGYGLSMTPENILGFVSLVLWALIIKVCIKYQLFVLRADNKGEGGILALLTLLDPWRARHKKRSRILIALGIFGAALLYGDGMITPAITTLGAVEGLQVATPSLQRWVIILVAVIVLILLFVFQKSGTKKIGFVFGPVMVLWFLVIGVLGLVAIIQYPAVLVAVNPAYALHFILHHGFADIVVLGAVFLCVTGAEALYADVGHFGQAPIRFSWFLYVMPALLLNYFGQAAAILAHPDQVGVQPFYNLAPTWFLYPLVVLA
ncbi:MAG: KUP/HAK/KT family potassium transporter, partial [Gammaproteobacteria bacterium]